MVESLVIDIIPENDVQRVEALRRYNILDTPPEESFNNIVRLMTEVFDIPIALISLVDAERVFFKANAGMPGVKNADRNVSLCAFAILSAEPTVFEKPLEEPCLLSNPLVQGDFGLRFYAGAPLTTRDGYNIGSVCIVDKKERSFPAANKKMLERFAKIVMHEIDLREAAILQREAEEALMKNKKRFDLVAKATQDAVWDWDLQTQEIWWNDGFKVLFGYTAEEIEPTIDSWYNRVHPEDKDRVVGGIHEVINKGEKNWSDEYRFRKKDGSYAIVLDRGYALHDHEGKPNRMLGSMQDITQRKEAELAALNQSRVIHTIANNTTSTLFLMNKEGVCTFINSTGKEMFGYSLEELVQKPIHELIHHHYPDGTPFPREVGPLETAIRENRPIQRNCELFFRKDGSSFPASCSASPIYENGVVTSAVIEIRDITAELEAEELLRRSALELEQKVQERTLELSQVNEQLKQFTYAASHDLQEPLRKISFFLDRLTNNIGPTLNEDDKQITERLLNTTERMRNLINDLLAYSNTSHGPNGFEEVKVTDLLNEVLDDMEAIIIEKNAIVKLADLPIIKGDRRQLRQLFQNLISNAMKYHKREEAPQVFIAARPISGNELDTALPVEKKDKQFFLIEVKDNGIGFNPEDAQRIFRLFQRLHGKAEYEGTGVGLAIVQKVMENHGGYIWAESAPGKGATFKILLPAD